MATTTNEYKVEIIASSRPLTRREAIKFKDNGNATPLNKVVSPENPVRFTPVLYVLTHTHNERTKPGQNPDYDTLCVEDADGKRWYSGSESLRTSFLSIWEEMMDDDGNPAEEYEVEIRQIASSNRDGQYFLKCFVI